jgi:aspartate/tyrosine/aromatic aminotransferase
MFSSTVLNKEQARLVRDKYAISMLDDGRINVAELSQSNVNDVCQALAAVTKY